MIISLKKNNVTSLSIAWNFGVARVLVERAPSLLVMRSNLGILLYTVDYHAKKIWLVSHMNNAQKVFLLEEKLKRRTI